MAHPVVIMAYEKSDAIGAAVAALEESGLEVVVLNTAKAKLVNFLGAIAGVSEDDEDEPETEEPKEKEDDTTNTETEEPNPEVKADVDSKKPEEITTEGSIEDEKILIKIVEGSTAKLFPSTISIGSKTIYTLNESSFSFWPSAIGNEPVKGGINLSFDGIKEFIQVSFSEEIKNPPVLELGRDLLAQLKS